LVLHSLSKNEGADKVHRDHTVWLATLQNLEYKRLMDKRAKMEHWRGSDVLVKQEGKNITHTHTHAHTHVTHTKHTRHTHTQLRGFFF